MRTLSDLVSGALSQSTEAIKTASAKDSAPVFDFEKIAAEGLPPEATDGKKDDDAKASKSKDDDKGEKKAPPKSKKDKDDDKDDAKEKRATIAEAHRYAGALKIAAVEVEKLALHQDPKVAPTAQPGASSIPKPPKASTDPGKEGVHGTQLTRVAGGGEKVSAQQWVKDKGAAAAAINAKIASASVLADLGLKDAADHVLAEAEAMKLAQDPSSPQPQLPAPGNGGHTLAIDPAVPTGKLPESPAAIAALTKATARDTTTREAGAHIEQKPAKDNMVAPTTITTHGQKVSSLFANFKAQQGAR